MPVSIRGGPSRTPGLRGPALGAGLEREAVINDDDPSGSRAAAASAVPVNGWGRGPENLGELDLPFIR
ncbi:hypothetical protein GCM10014713_00440 [Streptomyces purpureus]|uniref:Uncharacterized protein n=1 Tax=Streptomyces purpureus TaxID=1951 RepID=A0A918GXG4_9ACTN|nr:hypothetical protein GCM10014713_00440 [Streptomyces purpureus]